MDVLVLAGMLIQCCDAFWSVLNFPLQSPPSCDKSPQLIPIQPIMIVALCIAYSAHQLALIKKFSATSFKFQYLMYIYECLYEPYRSGFYHTIKPSSNSKISKAIGSLQLLDVKSSSNSRS